MKTPLRKPSRLKPRFLCLAFLVLWLPSSHGQEVALEPPAESPAVVIELEALRLLTVDPPRRAVVRLPDGELRLVAPGELIPEAGATVVAVGEAVLKVEITSREGTATRVEAWLHVVDDSGVQSRVTRLNPLPPALETANRPEMTIFPESAHEAGQEHVLNQESTAPETAAAKLSEDEFAERVKEALRRQER